MNDGGIARELRNGLLDAGAWCVGLGKASWSFCRLSAF